jgi:hypothetical protein
MGFIVSDKNLSGTALAAGFQVKAEAVRPVASAIPLKYFGNVYGTKEGRLWKIHTLQDHCTASWR